MRLALHNALMILQSRQMDKWVQSLALGHGCKFDVMFDVAVRYTFLLTSFMSFKSSPSLIYDNHIFTNKLHRYESYHAPFRDENDFI